MSELLLTKRLHISGLTPSIKQADLERRLSSFGTVKAMDGFGACDALGDPRKFAFVTMEIGAKELAKCLNVLSGSTWKGAKLRIGEAKPNFRERLAQINSLPPRPVRLKRTRVRNHGHVSSTSVLTPLSTEVAASTPGWIVTPSGRVVRPMRMRPERPLEPTRSESNSSKSKGVNGKVKKRIKPPPLRARRRLIDPTKWDSVYLKGVFLDSVTVPSSTSQEGPSSEMHNAVGEMLENKMDGDASSDSTSSVVQKEVTIAPEMTTGYVETINLRDEANAALAILGEMFDDKEDWDGRESVDEMECSKDDDRWKKGVELDNQDEFEIVPRDFGKDSGVTKKDKGKGKEMPLMEDAFHEHGAGGGTDVEMRETDPLITDVEMQSQSAPTNLKALFAPREEASFSLLNHLDLDLELELDADILGINAPPGPPPQENLISSESNLLTSHVVQGPSTKSSTKARPRVTLDPSLPLLFPSHDSLPYPLSSSPNLTTTKQRRNMSTCFLFPLTTRVRGLHSLPSSTTFTRSPQDTPESVREAWERDKVSLTREWKKAWREARGSRRGRVGAAGDIGGF